VNEPEEPVYWPEQRIYMPEQPAVYAWNSLVYTVRLNSLVNRPLDSLAFMHEQHGDCS
jgi:hypothetical protein